MTCTSDADAKEMEAVKQKIIARMRSEQPRFWTLEEIDSLESGERQRLCRVVRAEPCGGDCDPVVTYEVMEDALYEFDGIKKTRFRTISVGGYFEFTGGYEGREPSADIKKLKRLIAILQDAVQWLEQPPYSHAND